MSSPDRFKPYAPDVQAVVRLEEALPPEHSIHVFVDLVQGVELRHFVIPPGPKGEKPYHPHALFGILAWGYLHGERSARKLARLARQAATFVYLAGGGQPNYRTLARFRRDTASQLIVTVDVVTVGSDMAQLGPGLDQVEARCGQVPGAVLVDGGFAATGQITAAEQRGVTVYAPVQQPKDPTRDPHQPRPDDSAAVAGWRLRMATDDAKAVYKERAATAECGNALARLRSLACFWVRGLPAVRCVALLVALTHSALRRHVLLQTRALATT